MRAGHIGAVSLIALFPLYGTGTSQELVFRGVCDGSGAIWLPGGEIASIDDEKEPRIRIYPEGGSRPLASLEIPGVSDAGIEPDLEARASAGATSLWIRSHGRDSKGRDRPERQVLIGLPTEALTLSDDGERPVSTKPDDCKDGEFALGTCTCKNVRNQHADRLRSFRALRMTIAP